MSRLRRLARRLLPAAVAYALAACAVFNPPAPVDVAQPTYALPATPLACMSENGRCSGIEAPIIAA